MHHQRTKRYQVIATLSILSMMAVSCGGDDDECAGHSHDPACLACEQVDHDSIAADTVKDGAAGALNVRIVAATPSPHQVGNNTLVLEVRDTSGQPLTGVTFTSRGTYYPPGGHGSPIIPIVTEDGNGAYSLTEINYIHEGAWQLNLELSAGSLTDSVSFEFCIVAPSPAGAAPPAS